MMSDTRDFHDEVKAKSLDALGLDAAAVETMLEERAAARASKDWTRADAIREQLDALGIDVLDQADGVEWRVRLGGGEA
jgi:cysteinyl-tRNA synthetase